MSHWRIVLGAALALVLAAPPADAASLAQLRRGVFKIMVTSNEPNFTDPWKKLASSHSSGTGFYIGDGRILTNAHVVANAAFLTVLRDGDSKPIPAYVRFIGHDCDLAVLETESQEPFEGLEPMRFGPLPKLRSPVSTIGFPMGGEQVSITEGVVSRVSYRGYVHHGEAQHVLVQVDSAINPGNSGGPVVQGRLVVGVAFQSFTRAENTGYIIPTVVVNRFLKDVEDGVYDGHPEDGITTSGWSMLNPSTAAYHGLSPKDGGVKVAHVAKWSAANPELQPGDILLEIDGQDIGVDGKVSFQGERVDFRTLFDLKQIGDEVRFKVSRAGAVRNVPVKVSRAPEHPRSSLIYAKHAKYFVYGGLVFTTLTKSFLRTWGERWYKDAPLLLRFLDSYSSYQPETAELTDVVVLAKRLPDVVNAYATGNVFGVVKEVDGHPISSLPQLVERLEGGTDEFLRIGFFGSDDPLVLARKVVQERNAAINARYGVVPDRWLAGAEDDGAVTREPAANATAKEMGVKP
jgi:S1-C subfamily serine protease